MITPEYTTNWMLSPPGQYLLGWEQSQLDDLVNDIFGYHAVQIGLPQLDALRENRMSNRVLMLEQQSPADTLLLANRTIILGDFLDLPLETASIDLLILPHTLELTANPHRLLREAERVLVPEGQLIIVGLNSFSLWAVRQTFSSLNHNTFMPHIQHIIAFNRLKDWVKLLGFEFGRGRFGCYRPPLYTQRWLDRYAFMEQAGSRWWPVFGAIYILTAVKRVLCMRLVGPSKWPKKIPLTVPVPVTAPIPHTQR